MLRVEHQRGVALLTALLVLALASVVAWGLVSNAQRSLAAASAGARGLQARLVARGMEEFALAALARDELLSPGIDHLGEAWAGSLPPLPFDRGFVSARLSDLNGRFNLNSLVRADGSADPLAQQRFERLLLALDLPATLVAPLTDWIDPDTQSLPGGAEDLDYLRATPGYRCPNRPLRDVSELVGLAGLDAETWKRLQPMVSALPRTSVLNLNTAPWPVLAAIVPGIDAAGMERLRPDGQHWSSIDDFRRALGGLSLNLQPGQEGGLGFASGFFLATAEIEIDGAGYRFQSLLERGGAVLAVRWRQRGAD